MKKKIRVIGYLPNENDVILGYAKNVDEATSIMVTYTDVFPEIAFTLKTVTMLPYETGVALNNLFKSLNGKPLWQI